MAHPRFEMNAHIGTTLVIFLLAPLAVEHENLSKMQKMGLPTHAPQTKIAQLSNDFYENPIRMIFNFCWNLHFEVERPPGLSTNLLEQRKQFPMPSRMRWESYGGRSVNIVWLPWRNQRGFEKKRKQ